MRALIAHPGRQHSHQLALALHQANCLAGYWSGIPSRHRFLRHEPIDVPAALVRCNPVAPFAIKAANAMLPLAQAKALEQRAYEAFDRWVAKRIPACRDADLFVGYETASLASFAEAKRRGMTTVLDAASIHHAAQDRLHGHVDSPAEHARACRIKDREVELADHVLTVSELARQSYLEGGVAREKLHVVTLGADLSLFTPGPAGARDGQPFTFVFAGSLIRRKGLDLLLEAFAALHATHPAIRLLLAGGSGDLSTLVARAGAGVEALGPVTQARLASVYRAADVMVLPSRNDSYGMVVAEALACGVPVIVSDMVGAKSAVDEGRNGWTVATGDLGALAARMAWCVEHPEDVRRMREAAQRSSSALGWPAYRGRVVDVLSRIGGER